MLFGPYVCFFILFLTFFFVTNSCVIGFTYKLMMEKDGNEGNGIVWAIGMCFFFITFFIY